MKNIKKCRLCPDYIIFKQLIISSCLLSLSGFGEVIISSHQVLVDFDTPGDYNDNFFNFATFTDFEEVVAGGLGGSGKVNLSASNATQVSIFDQVAFSGSQPFWKVSAYFRKSSQPNNFSLGLVSSPTAWINSGLLNSNNVQPNNGGAESTVSSLGISANWYGSMSLYNSNNIVAWTDLGDFPDTNWIYMELTGSYLAGGHTLDGRVFVSDESGNIGIQVGPTLSVSDLSNQLGVDDKAYFFFGADDLTSAHHIDNFAITIPEPSSVVALLSFMVLIVTTLRKRAVS